MALGFLTPLLSAGRGSRQDRLRKGPRLQISPSAAVDDMVTASRCTADKDRTPESDKTGTTWPISLSISSDARNPAYVYKSDDQIKIPQALTASGGPQADL